MMLKKLKTKFVIINMSLVGVVLLLVFTVVIYNTYKQEMSEIDKALEMALMNERQKDDVPREIGKPAELPKNSDIVESQPVRPFEYSTVVAIVNDDGITLTGNDNAQMDEDTLNKSVAKVTKTSNAKTPSGGKLSDMNLFYETASTSDSHKIAFADSSYFDKVMKQSLTVSAVLFLLGMITLLLISILLSRIAVSPVKKAWQQQQQFVADASHELKTPLTVLLANNEIMLLHRDRLSPDQLKWLESSQEEASHMKNLINDLLFLAKSDENGGATTVVKSDTDLSQLITGVCLQMEPLIFDKGIVLFDYLIEDGLKLICNETQIKQLVHILLDNAVKYADENKYISLDLRRYGNKKKLTVINTSAPVASVDMEHIFDRFYRSDKARSREGGYGLGLSIAKTIVESHGGTISAACTLRENLPAAGSLNIDSSRDSLEDNGSGDSFEDGSSSDSLEEAGFKNASPKNKKITVMTITVTL